MPLQLPQDFNKLTDDEKAAFQSFEVYENIIKSDLTDERSSDDIAEISIEKVATKLKERNGSYRKTKRIVQNGIVIPHKIKTSIFRRVMLRIFGLIDFLTSPIIG